MSENGCHQEDVVVFARHIDYTSGGKPIFRLMSPFSCATSLPAFAGGRHRDYTVAGIPRYAVGWSPCCDLIRDTYKEDSCWPLTNGLGQGPGITDWITLNIYNVTTCPSAQCQEVILKYNLSEAAWFPDSPITLRGGLMYVMFECRDGLAFDDAEKFRLTLSGCHDGGGIIPVSCGTAPVDCDEFIEALVGFNCVDPLVINFGNLEVPDCCDCPLEHTDTTAEINAVVSANCRTVVQARHIRYSTGGIPVFATENNCIWSQHVPSCADAQCGLTAIVSGAGCMSGTYILDHVGDPSTEWEYTIGWPSCPAPGHINLTCTDNGDGTVTLVMNVVCGADIVGTDSIIIDAEDLEDLDETFIVEMIDPTPAECEGECVYTCIGMAGSWVYTSDDCTEECSGCPDPIDVPDPCEEENDSETTTTPCLGGEEDSPCPVGNISIRVMR